jgi:hypothetical protein
MVYAPSDKALLANIDHEYPEKTLTKMLRMRECGRDFFNTCRTSLTTGRLRKGHSNFLLSRARFLRQ